jgi:hypothetical protein
VVSGLRWVSLKRSKEFLEQRMEYINGGKWSEMGFSEEECRVFGAKKGVYKRWLVA